MSETVGNAHVIVVGSGLAGLCATISAHSAGARVTLIEKEQRTGGNSAKATSGMNACGSAHQISAGIADSESAFREDTQRAGHGMCDAQLVDMLATKAPEALEWLEAQGVSLGRLSQCGGHSVPRTHRVTPNAEGKAPPVGWTIVSTLRKLVDTFAADRCKILTGLRVESVLEEERAIERSVSDTETAPEVMRFMCGVAGTTADGEAVTVMGDSVVLCCGGYAFAAAEDALLPSVAPAFAAYPTTNGSFAVGDGVRLATAVGAHTRDMDKVQVHPTGFVDPANPASGVKFLAPEALRGCGGVLLSVEGRRFADELTTRDALTAAINTLGCPGSEVGKATATLVLSQSMVDAFGADAVGFYQSKGLFRRVEGAAGVAADVGVDEAVVVEELKAYADAAAAGRDAFGKTVFPGILSASEPLYVATITPAIHYTMGGVSIGPTAEVLRKTEAGTMKPIVGLFAAGETTGGVHGGNRLAGNSLLECVVFGRIAGERAAANLLTSDANGLHADEWRPLQLRHRRALADNVAVYSFALPRPWQRSGLGLGQYIAVRAVLEEKEQIRYYSPISRPDDPGHLDLLIKSDGRGCMSSHIDHLRPGDSLQFRGPMGGIDLTHSAVKHIGLVAGGVGISPMVQILRHVLHQESLRPADERVQVRLIYGANVADELVFVEELRKQEREHPNFTMTLVLNTPPEGWTGLRGFIGKDILAEHMFSPREDLRVVLCGPPGMCRALKPQFADLGYTGDMFFSYM